MQANPRGTAHAVSIASKLLAAAIVTAAPVSWAVTPVNTCGQTLGIHGETYVLTADLACDASSPVVAITADGVTFDLQGHSISDAIAEGSLQRGIEVIGVSNVAIRNGSVIGFHYGIWLEGATNAHVSGITATENMYAIRLEGSGRCTIENNTAHDNLHGIELVSSTMNQITGNTTNDNRSSNVSYPAGGIALSGSSHNLVARNTAVHNSIYGITLGGGSAGNLVFDNVIENTMDGSDHARWGIVVDDSTGNVFRANRSNFNEYGIRMNNGAIGNTLVLNVMNGNKFGIVLFDGATGNRMVRNTVSASTDTDIKDLNPACDSNVWAANLFTTDNETGLGAGPGTGCIQ